MSRAVKLSELPASVRAKLKPAKKRATRTAIERVLRESSETQRRETFYAMLRRCRLPMPEAEFKFHASRKWRFDFAWPAQRIALEVEGGIWTQGRHSRGAGMLADMEKYSEAALLGWCVLRVVPDDLSRLRTETWLRRALADGGNKLPVCRATLSL